MDHRSPDTRHAAQQRAPKPAESGAHQGGLSDMQDIVMLQRQLGNRAVQRLLAQREAVTPKPSTVPAMKHITVDRALGSQRRIQRNVFHDMFRGYARKNIFGKNKERRKIEKDTATVKKEMSAFFKNITDISVKSGPHTLAGRYYKGVDKKDANDGGAYAGKTVLFLSGSGGSAETYGLQIARYYCVRGADVVAVNYRGFGGSTVEVKGKQKQMDNSEITEQGVYDDSQAIFKHMTDSMGIDPGSVIIHGFSLGGPVAAQLVAHLAGLGIRVGGLVLHSPMDSVREQAKQNAPTRGIGAFAANAGGVTMDLKQHLTALSKIDGFKDLAIHFMSGKAENDDQLDINKTKVDDVATGLGFTNTSKTVSNEGDHLAVSDHMKTAGKGANTYDNPANSLARLFATPVDVSQVAPDETPPPQMQLVIGELISVLGEDIQKAEIEVAETESTEGEQV
jgi:pimeloyl-ACP methyl ester carboxylesterase